MAKTTKTKSKASTKAETTSAAAETTVEATPRRGGRTAYECPPKHRDALKRGATRVRIARKALDEAQDSLYTKAVAALAQGVKPSAIARAMDEPYITVQRIVNKARENGDI